MKFTIDTEKKEITLLESITFKQLDSLKKYLGDYKKWKISGEINNNWTWYPYPYYRGDYQFYCTEVTPSVYLVDANRYDLTGSVASITTVSNN